MNTLANRLGITTPVTPLLRKVERLSGGAPIPWLVETANRRGFDAVLRSGADLPGYATPTELSDYELAVAFLLPGMPDEPQSLRLAAQMIGRGAVEDSGLLLFIAEREGALRILASLAAQALKVAPFHTIWLGLATWAGVRPLQETLIHWTRLAEPVMAARGPHTGLWKLVA